MPNAEAREEAAVIDGSIGLAAPLLEVGSISLTEAEQFVYAEARLADQHRYDEWEALWTDDALYWVPANAEFETDPDTAMSILYDNRSRISTRIKQLKTGKRHAQNPPSGLRRSISNIELLGTLESGDAHVVGNFICFESRQRGLTQWAGGVEWALRREPDSSLRMSRKTVRLVDNDRPLYSLSFLV